MSHHVINYKLLSRNFLQGPKEANYRSVNNCGN